MSKYDGSLIFDTSIDNKGFKKGVEGLGKVGKTTFSAVNKAIKGTVLAIGAMGVASIKMGSDFQAGMSRVGAISGATKQELEELTAVAKQLGRDTVFSATDAAEGMSNLAMAGFSTNEIISAMPGLLDAAAAGGTDLGVASDITANIIRSFGLEAEQAGHMADVLTLAFTSSNTSLESLGETMKYAGPVAKAAGWSLEETAAAAGLLGDAGIQGSMAGTALRGIMLRLINPPKQAAEALDELGVSITDSAGNIRPLHDIIGQLEKATDGMTDSQRTAVISQIAGQNAASGLLAIMERGSGTLKQFGEDLENSTGTAAEVAAKQLDNLQGDIKLLESAFEGLGISIFENIEGPLRQGVQALTDFIGEIHEIIQVEEKLDEVLNHSANSLEYVGYEAQAAATELQQLPRGFEAIADVVGSKLGDLSVVIAENLPKLIAMVKTTMESMANGIKESLPAISQAGVEILTGLIDLYISMAGEFLIIGIEIITQMAAGMTEKLPDLINTVSETLSNVLDSIIENLPIFIEAGIQMLEQFALGISENLPSLIDAGIEIIEILLNGIVDNIDTIIEAGLMIIETLGQSIADNITVIVDAAIDIADGLIEGIINNLPEIINTGLEIMLALIKGIVDNLPKLIENVPRIINDFASAIYDNIGNIIKAGIEIIIALGKGLIQAIPTLVANIPQIILAIINAFTLANFVNLGKNIISSLGQGITNTVSSIVGTAKSVATGVVEAIKGGWANAPNIGKGLINGLMNGIRSLLSGITEVAKGLASTVINTIKSLWSDAPNVGKALVQGIWNGISNVTGWILDKIKGFGNSVMNGIKDIFGIKSPSRRMRDEVGKELVRGIGVGIQDETPALRRLTETEMDKLISDYGKYGEAAAKEYAKLSTKELNELKKKHKGKGEELSKAIAEGQKAKLGEITGALDKIRSETLSQLDKLGDATVEALKRRYEEEEKVQLRALDKEVQNAEKASQRKIDQYNNELAYKLQLLNAESAAEIRALQQRIDSINAKTDEEERAIKEQDYRDKLAAKQSELLLAKSEKEKSKIKEEIDEMIATRERELLLERRKQQIEDLRTEIDNVRDKNDKKKQLLEEEYQTKIDNEKIMLENTKLYLSNERAATEEHYAELLKSENLQAEARKLMLDENNEELVELLDSYNPEWFDAGQSFGEQLLDGLNSMKYEIEEVVDSIMSTVSTVDTLDARILQAKQDYESANLRNDLKAMEAAHERAERYRRMGGTIGADVALNMANYNRQQENLLSSDKTRQLITENKKEFIQNNYITTTNNSPSEIARTTKRKGEDLLYGY